MTRAIVAMAAVVCVLLLAAPPAQSCSDPPPPVPDIWVTVLPNNVICIEFHNYSTSFASGGGTFCACALKNVPCLTVDSVQTTLSELNGFALNGTVGASASGPLGGPATGFLHQVTAPVPGATPFSLIVYLTVTCSDARNDVLNNLAANGLILTDEADAAGNLLGTHQGISVISPLMAIPTLSQWGLIAVVVLILAGGTWCLTRRRRPHSV